MSKEPPFAPFPTIGYQRLLCPEKDEGSPVYPPRVSRDRGESEIAEEGQRRGEGLEVQHQDRELPVVRAGGNKHVWP